MLQKTALDVMKSGHNVFLTGMAGSGKSFTIGTFIQYLREQKIPAHTIAVTATTGIAASNIKGITLHSFSCMGIKDYMTDKEIMNLLIQRKKRVQTITDSQILIIDEISMLHRKQFELSSRILSIAKKDSRPFGGMQVIVIGDFFQLPPVSKADINEQDRDRFAFMSKTWVDCKFQICYLTEQYRSQSNELNNVLNAIRCDEIDDFHVELLKNRMLTSDNDEILNLYTHNENVDMLNYLQLQKISTKSVHYLAECEGNHAKVKTILSSMTAPQNLELKVGAKVMFVRNDPEGRYVNGTQGVVIEFQANEEYIPPFVPLVKTVDGSVLPAEPVTWEYEENNKIVATVKQTPLRHAWAITIHKSQGMTLNQANINLGRVFESGQGYVALSRLSSIDGLFIEDFNMNALKLNPLARKADIRLQELSEELESNISKLSESQLKKEHANYLKTILKKQI